MYCNRHSLKWSNSMFRREFIRLASLTSGALAFNGPSWLTTHAGELYGETKALSSDGLYQLFVHPPNQFRPMVRWWWNGDRIDSSELLREMDVLQKAGIGGFEINPIKFPSNADPLDTHPLIWMSDEWVAALQVVMHGARARGLVCDMIVGSGWPFGGEFLSREDQTQMMALGTREFTGPQHVRVPAAELLNEVSPRVMSSYKDLAKEFVSASLVPYELSGPEQAVSAPFHKGADFVEFDVPAGRHVLYMLVKLTGYMAVINGAPGASGPVLNHYSAPAVARYLDRISDRLESKIGPLGTYLRAFFTDSIELEGANWCDDMFAEFKRRRGYDLVPYLPFVLFKVGEMGNAVSTAYGARFSPDFQSQTELVRYDFETTKRELFNERFVATFVAWCKRIGVKSRMQAYGMECDPISASMMVDIPECETWIHSSEVQTFATGDYARGRSYSMINKFVSSAAHLAGKQLISCEEMTNTEDPFHTTMERIKVAGDQSILSGVTQSVLHGFNYSPPAAAFPGWVRYGTYFSERNPWWPYIHLWFTYKARLSALFQHAEMYADIAILPPQADLASRFGFQRDPFPRIAYPPYLFKLWEAIHQNGSGCDYLSEQVISQSVVRDGRLIFGRRSYRAVILPAVESLQPETVERLQSFVETGGTILFLDKIPHLADGLARQAENAARVQSAIVEMRQHHPDRTPLLSVNELDMAGWYQDLQRRFSLTPDVLISQPTDFISQIHYRSAEQDFFFFTHYGPETRHTFDATFHTANKEAWLWNAETGGRTPLHAKGKPGSFSITLGPCESQLIVFETSKATGKLATSQSPMTSAKAEPLAGPWKVQLDHIDGTAGSITLDELVDFKGRKDLSSFAGTITYSKTLMLDSAQMPEWLDLGDVHAISELHINGQEMGVRWYGEHLYRLSGLKRGPNVISIKVVTTLGNYMKTLTNNPTAMAWTSHTPSYPLGLVRPPKLISALENE
jgi:hypothetical protein